MNGAGGVAFNLHPLPNPWLNILPGIRPLFHRRLAASAPEMMIVEDRRVPRLVDLPLIVAVELFQVTYETFQRLVEWFFAVVAGEAEKHLRPAPHVNGNLLFCKAFADKEILVGEGDFFNGVHAPILKPHAMYCNT